MSTTTPTQQIVDSIKRIEERMAPIDGLLKILAEPASKAGLTPEAFLASMCKGRDATMIGADGASLPVPRRRKRGGIGMGKMLSALVEMGTPGMNSADLQKSANYLFDPVEKGGLGMVKAALAESSGVSGGYTVPPQFAEQLLSLAIEDTIVPPRAYHQPMTSLTLQLPSLDVTGSGVAGQSPFLGGVAASWGPEATIGAESEPTFGQTDLKANQLSFYSIVSNTLLADSAIGLDSLLTHLFAAAIGFYTDYAFLQGTGVGQPLGVMNSPAAISVTRNTGGAFKYIDAAMMFSRLYGVSSWRNEATCWVVHPYVFPQLTQMYDGGGRPVFIPLSSGAQEMPANSGQGGYSIGHLFGRPVLVSEKISTLGTRGDVLLCDFSKYVIGDRAELMIDVSPHVKFLNYQLVFRCIWRGDGQPWLNKPITLADGASTVSPFVILN